MQNLEGISVENSKPVVTSINSASKSNDKLIEQKEPLIQEVNNQLGMVAISYLAGTIGKEETFRFKKLVFRATRGKAYTYFRDLDTAGLADYSGTLDKRLRSVYVIVFQEGVNTRSKLTRICESFMGRSIDVPSSGFGHVEIANKVRDL